MTPTLVKAEYIDGYRIRLYFDDGKSGEIDLEGELRGEVFEPLKEMSLFKQFQIHDELRTLVWPTGADLAPEFLYQKTAA